MLCGALPALAHDPITTNITWTNEISRLVYRHCEGCHQQGGQAMPLESYTQVRPWAKAIRDEVLARRMPPWDPVKGVGDFRDDASLSIPEIDLFVRWVEGGAPEGDSSWLAVREKPPRIGANAVTPPHGMRLNAEAVLRKPTPVAGIWAGGPLELTALLPDHSVERLLWIRDFHQRWNRVYWLRERIVLPAGTRIFVRSASGATATLVPEFKASAPAK